MRVLARLQWREYAVIGNVLNHGSIQSTAIYARLNISPVTRALEENSVRRLPTAPRSLARRSGRCNRLAMRSARNGPGRAAISENEDDGGSAVEEQQNHRTRRGDRRQEGERVSFQGQCIKVI